MYEIRTLEIRYFWLKALKVFEFEEPIYCLT